MVPKGEITGRLSYWMDQGSSGQLPEAIGSWGSLRTSSAFVYVRNESLRQLATGETRGVLVSCVRVHACVCKSENTKRLATRWTRRALVRVCIYVCVSLRVRPQGVSY